MGFETKTIRIAMNGITGRMGYRQHLLRSILPIRDNGGFTLEDGTKVQVEPIVVGRNEAKIRELAELHKVSEWTTDLDAVINDPTADVVFDASSWNYRKEDGGGMTTDMFCHWNYVLEGIIGKVTSVNPRPPPTSLPGGTRPARHTRPRPMTRPTASLNWKHRRGIP